MFKVIVAVCVLVGLAGQSCSQGRQAQDAGPTHEPSAVGDAVGKDLAAFATARLASAGEWQASPQTPLASCGVGPLNAAGSAVDLGQVMLTGTGSYGVPLRTGVQKVEWRVMAGAGHDAVVTSAHRGNGALLFSLPRGGTKESPSKLPDQVGVSQLRFKGPFGAGRRAYGYLIPSHPGCYDLTATWDGGQATASVWINLVK